MPGLFYFELNKKFVLKFGVVVSYTSHSEFWSRRSVDIQYPNIL